MLELLVKDIIAPHLNSFNIINPMKKTFTITLQSNQGISPQVAFVVSGAKAEKIIDMIQPEIKKKKKQMESSSVKITDFLT